MKKLLFLLAMIGIFSISCCKKDHAKESTNENQTEEPDNKDDGNDANGNDPSVTSVIYYITSDGEVVEPNFKANITSNSYEDGQGAIVFDIEITSIDAYAFEDCTNLTGVTIPDSVTAVGNFAFSGCTGLISVTIPDSVTKIGSYAFDDCSSLTDVTIPDSVTTIGNYAFCNCSSLTSITIPDSVTTIGEGAFAGCSSLTEFRGKYASEDGKCLIIDGSLISFAPAGLTEYTIPDSVTTIGYQAFYNCSSLTSVTIPDSVTTIGEKAFAYCSRDRKSVV